MSKSKGLLKEFNVNQQVAIIYNELSGNQFIPINSEFHGAYWIKTLFSNDEGKHTQDLLKCYGIHPQPGGGVMYLMCGRISGSKASATDASYQICFDEIINNDKRTLVIATMKNEPLHKWVFCYSTRPAHEDLHVITALNHIREHLGEDRVWLTKP